MCDRADGLPVNVTLDVREERVRKLEQCLRYCVKEIQELLAGTPRASWSVPPARRVLGDLQDGGPLTVDEVDVPHAHGGYMPPPNTEPVNDNRALRAKRVEPHPHTEGQGD